MEIVTSLIGIIVCELLNLHQIIFLPPFLNQLLLHSHCSWENIATQHISDSEIPARVNIIIHRVYCRSVL